MGISRQKLEVQKHLKRLNKPALKTIQSPDGDTIDCVHPSHQPAFDHPFLRNHTIQLRANFHPESLYDENKVTSTTEEQKSKSITQLWHLNGRCPEGTKRFGRKRHKSIPKPRSADPNLVDESGHQHAIAYVEGGKYYGAKAKINVWEPRIEQSNEFSLSQIWVLGGISV